MGRNHIQIVSMFVGNVISLILYGALIVQLYQYYISFPKDPRLFKAVVYIVFITETIYTIILTRDLGYILIEHVGDACLLFPVVPICGAIVALLTQAMYAYRVHIITKMTYVSWSIVVCIVTQLIVITILTSFRKPFPIIVIVWTSLSVVADTTIAVVMVWTLKKDEIHLRSFKRKVTRLVFLIIGTGILTGSSAALLLSHMLTANVAVVNFVTLITNVLSNSLGPAIVLSKLYANAMMILVNDRASPPHSENDRGGMTDMITVQISPLRTETGTVDSAANGSAERRASKEMVDADSTKE